MPPPRLFSDWTARVAHDGFRLGHPTIDRFVTLCRRSTSDFFSTFRRGTGKRPGGLGHDPTSLPLRSLLGSTQERIGHFYDALDTYSDALNLIVYEGTGYRRRNPESTKRQRSGKRVIRRVLSADATQLMRRYLTVITLPERWTDRWLHDLLRAGDPNAAVPIRGDEFADAYSEPSRRVLIARRNDEHANRANMARRLARFLHQRYQTLLTTEFPLLEHLLLHEDRWSPLAGQHPIDSTSGRKPPTLDAALAKDGISFDPAAVVELHLWTAWLLNDLRRRRPCVSTALRHLKAWQRDHIDRIEPTYAELVRAVLTGDPGQWQRLRLDRQKLFVLLADVVHAAATVEDEPADRIPNLQSWKQENGRRSHCSPQKPIFRSSLCAPPSRRRNNYYAGKQNSKGVLDETISVTKPRLRVVQGSDPKARVADPIARTHRRSPRLAVAATSPETGEGVPCSQDVQATSGESQTDRTSTSDRATQRSKRCSSANCTPKRNRPRMDHKGRTWNYWYYLACIDSNAMKPDPRAFTGTSDALYRE